MTTIVAVTTHDLRARTSAFLHGSDANHPDPDYSAAYVVLHTDGAHEGHGMTFTIGKGNELCCAISRANRLHPPQIKSRFPGEIPHFSPKKRLLRFTRSASHAP